MSRIGGLVPFRPMQSLVVYVACQIDAIHPRLCSPEGIFTRSSPYHPSFWTSPRTGRSVLKKVILVQSSFKVPQWGGSLPSESSVPVPYSEGGGSSSKTGVMAEREGIESASRERINRNEELTSWISNIILKSLLEQHRFKSRRPSNAAASMKGR